MTEEIFGILIHCISAVLTWIISYSLFEQHIKNENGHRNFIFKDYIKNEELLLGLKFFKSTASADLIKRVPLLKFQPKARKYSLIFNVEQEHDRNLSQQFYVSDSCWRNTTAHKNNSLKNIAIFETKLVFLIDTLESLLLPEDLKSKFSSELAVVFLKIEV